MLALVGAYLALALVISGWRRSRKRLGGTAVLVAAGAVWAVVVSCPWLSLSVWQAALVAALFSLLAAGFVRVGTILASRGVSLGALVWLLGPIEALALAVGWAAEWRSRRSRGQVGEEEIDSATESVLELSETTVGEVMTPRSEMVSIGRDATVADWVDLVLSSGHGQIPVHAEERDEIVGILQMEDLLDRPPADAPVSRFVRTVRFVPESMRCDDLLREMVASGERAAIVVDEYGGTSGFVTDRHLLEILLGDLEASSPAEKGILVASRNLLIVDGACKLDDLTDFLGREMPEGDYETVAGLILERARRIPLPGETFRFPGMSLQVIDADERRIRRVRVLLSGGSRRAKAGVTTEKSGRRISAG